MAAVVIYQETQTHHILISPDIGARARRPARDETETANGARWSIDRRTSNRITAMAFARGIRPHAIYAPVRRQRDEGGRVRAVPASSRLAGMERV